MAEKAEKLNKALNSFNPQHVMRVGEAIGKLGGMIGSLVSSLSSMVSSIRVLFDPDTTGWEKFIAVLTAVSVALPMLGNAAKRAAELIEFLNKAESISTIQKGLQAAASWLQAKATNIAGESSKKAAKEVDKETAALKRNTKAKLENAVADQLDGQMDFFDQMGDVVKATAVKAAAPNNK